MCAAKMAGSMPLSRRMSVVAVLTIMLSLIAAALGGALQAQPSTLDTIQRDELRLQDRQYIPPPAAVPAPPPKAVAPPVVKERIIREVPVPAARPPAELPPTVTKSQLTRDLKLTDEERKRTNADIDLYKAEIDKRRIQQDALRQDARQKRLTTTEADKNIQNLDREIGFREELIKAEEKKKSALTSKIEALKAQIGLIK